MLTLKAINEDAESIMRKLAKKNFDGKTIIADIIATDAKRRSTQAK